MSASTESAVSWIAVDWGTTHMRAWAMGAEDRVLERAESADGMGRLEATQFEAALLAVADDWLAPGRTTDVLVCGMAGARTGWVESGYETLPCRPQSKRNTVTAPVSDPRLRARILYGLKQVAPADVMRGEETQIAGLLTRNPSFEGIVCLPGTHTKWVSVEAGSVAKFTTVMTGELYSLLVRQSILRQSVDEAAWNEAAFAEACDRAFTAPSRLTADLFSIRAEQLLSALDPATANARVSGYLLGAELAATRDLWSGRDVAIVGAARLAGLYGRALGCHGVAPDTHDAEDLTLSGLIAAHRATEQGEPS